MQDAAEGLVDGDVVGRPILGWDGKGLSWDRTIVQALMRPETIIPRNKGIGDEGVPDRILIALFPKLTLYEFRLETAPFPEFLKVLEKLPAPNSDRTCSRINAVRCADFGLLEAFSAIPESVGE